MSENTEPFDADWLSPPTAIAVAHMGAWREDGSPIPWVSSAICDVCRGWATRLCVSGNSKGDSDSAPGVMINTRVSRLARIVVFACTEHYQQVMDALCDEHGQSSNQLSDDDLVNAVQRHANLEWKATR